jgi:pimeloyl-ACP methyl ester carboxylesterase
MDKSIPFALKLIRFLFGITQTLAPSLADKWSVSLFLSPRRSPFTEAGKRMLKKVEIFDIKANGKSLKAYRMGEGPEVVCLHGWAGKATQFSFIADALVKAGFTFVAVDAWAHGMNPGKSASMFDFADAFSTVLNKCENPIAVIGHSLGAAGISFAVSEGTAIPKLITLGAPALANDILDSFRDIIQAKPRTNEAIRVACRAMFNRDFDEVTMSRTFESVKVPVFGIHGEEDFDVGIHHLDALKALNPDMKTMRVPNLGHRRILKDETTVREIVRFIKE